MDEKEDSRLTEEEIQAKLLDISSSDDEELNSRKAELDDIIEVLDNQSDLTPELQTLLNDAKSKKGKIRELDEKIAGLGKRYKDISEQSNNSVKEWEIEREKLENELKEIDDKYEAHTILVEIYQGLKKKESPLELTPKKLDSIKTVISEEQATQLVEIIKSFNEHLVTKAELDNAEVEHETLKAQFSESHQNKQNQTPKNENLEGWISGLTKQIAFYIERLNELETSLQNVEAESYITQENNEQLLKVSNEEEILRERIKQQLRKKLPDEEDRVYLEKFSSLINKMDSKELGALDDNIPDVSKIKTLLDELNNTYGPEFFEDETDLDNPAERFLVIPGSDRIIKIENGDNREQIIEKYKNHIEEEISQVQKSLDSATAERRSNIEALSSKSQETTELSDETLRDEVQQSSERISILQAKLDALGGKIPESEDLQPLVAKYSAQLKALEENYSMKETEIEQLHNDIEKSNPVLTKIQVEIDELTQQKKNLKEEMGKFILNISEPISKKAEDRRDAYAEENQERYRQAPGQESHNQSFGVNPDDSQKKLDISSSQSPAQSEVHHFKSLSEELNDLEKDELDPEANISSVFPYDSDSESSLAEQIGLDWNNEHDDDEKIIVTEVDDNGVPIETPILLGSNEFMIDEQLDVDNKRIEDALPLMETEEEDYSVKIENPIQTSEPEPLEVVEEELGLEEEIEEIEEAPSAGIIEGTESRPGLKRDAEPLPLKHVPPTPERAERLVATLNGYATGLSLNGTNIRVIESASKELIGREEFEIRFGSIFRKAGKLLEGDKHAQLTDLGKNGEEGRKLNDAIKGGLREVINEVRTAMKLTSGEGEEIEVGIELGNAIDQTKFRGVLIEKPNNEENIERGDFNIPVVKWSTITPPAVPTRAAPKRPNQPEVPVSPILNSGPKHILNYPLARVAGYNSLFASYINGRPENIFSSLLRDQYTNHTIIPTSNFSISNYAVVPYTSFPVTTYNTNSVAGKNYPTFNSKIIYTTPEQDALMSEIFKAIPGQKAPMSGRVELNMDQYKDLYNMLFPEAAKAQTAVVIPPALTMEGGEVNPIIPYAAPHLSSPALPIRYQPYISLENPSKKRQREENSLPLNFRSRSTSLPNIHTAHTITPIAVSEKPEVVPKAPEEPKVVPEAAGILALTHNNLVGKTSRRGAWFMQVNDTQYTHELDDKLYSRNSENQQFFQPVSDFKVQKLKDGRDQYNFNITENNCAVHAVINKQFNSVEEITIQPDPKTKLLPETTINIADDKGRFMELLLQTNGQFVIKNIEEGFTKPDLVLHNKNGAVNLKMEDGKLQGIYETKKVGAEFVIEDEKSASSDVIGKVIFSLPPSCLIEQSKDISSRLTFDQPQHQTKTGGENILNFWKGKGEIKNNKGEIVMSQTREEFLKQAWKDLGKDPSEQSKNGANSTDKKLFISHIIHLGALYTEFFFPTKNDLTNHSTYLSEDQSVELAGVNDFKKKMQEHLDLYTAYFETYKKDIFSSPYNTDLHCSMVTQILTSLVSFGMKDQAKSFRETIKEILNDPELQIKSGELTSQLNGHKSKWDMIIDLGNDLNNIPSLVSTIKGGGEQSKTQVHSFTTDELNRRDRVNASNDGKKPTPGLG